MQGWGPQRTALGEQSARAICLLSLLRATSVFPARTAAPASGFSGLSFPMIQWGRTPVDVAIPAFLWSRAVERGRALTASDGVRGAARLPRR